MDSLSSFQLLQNLQQDLVALLDSRLNNVNRLIEELEASLADLRRLLERNKKSEESRRAIKEASVDKQQPQLGPVITIDGARYAITEDFKNAVYAVSDELDLDELEAASLCIDIQNRLDVVDETLPYRAILQYHERRRILLDCVRLILSQVVEADKSEDVYNVAESLHIVADEIIQWKSDQPGSFWDKCCEGLADCEERIRKTRDQLQALAMTGQALHSDYGEVLEAQRMSLAVQHELLAGIMCYLTRAKYVSVHDYRRILSKASVADAQMDIISHYAAPLVACATFFGAGISNTGDSQALEMHKFVTNEHAQREWKSEELKAAARLWWLVEYSSRHADGQTASEDKLKDDEAAARRDMFFECLRGKALHFMIALAEYFKPEVWFDSMRADLVGYLHENAIIFPADSTHRNDWFAQLTMEEFQNFTEALISHMPDVLRQLKSEEDNERRNLSVSNSTMYEMHLERFLLIAAYAYQDDADAAMEFWSDKESNLYGFLRWTSRRLPTPRVAAFCELMRALANEERTADHAHRFLLEETTTLGSRARKACSVSWTQIFNELDLYASMVHNRPALHSTSAASLNAPKDPDIIEHETSIMLDAYLRLAAHVIRNSQQARDWVLREQSFRLHETVLKLAQSSTTAKVQAGCFTVLAALVTGKPPDVSDGLWTALDSWLSGGGSALHENQRPQTAVPSPKQYFLRIGTNIEAATAFVHLLNDLIAPAPGSSELSLDSLPFPEQLGSARRRNGIDIYVDFVFEEAFLSTVDPAVSADRKQIAVLRHACLHFAQLCLSSFNDMLILLHRNKHHLADSAALLRPFESYARIHPFARTMEYMFNDRVSALLLDVAQQNTDELETLDNGSPLVQSTIKAVQVINLVLKLQSAYFDVVRPAIKMQTTVRGGSSVANPAISSFDEVLSLHLPLTSYLVQYITCDRNELAFTSIQLLHETCKSRRLAGYATGNTGVRDPQRLISQLAERSDAVQVVLRQIFNQAVQQVESGPDSILLQKAQAILGLLQDILDSATNGPNIAHCLLGFKCHRATIDVEPESLFSDGKSLFHAIAAMVAGLPSGIDNDHPVWLVPVRSGCIQLLSTLASSALTRNIVLDELRSLEFIAALQALTVPITTESLWDGQLSQDISFCHHEGALSLKCFIEGRESALELAAKEMQEVTTAGLASAQTDLIAVLSGEGAGLSLEVSLPTLVDFFDLHVATACAPEGLKYLMDVSPEKFFDSEGRLDVPLLQQVLVLKKRHLWSIGQIKDQTDEQTINDEIASIISWCVAENRYADIMGARLTALESWADLVASFVELTDDAGFAHKALQSVIPRLERSLREDIASAEQFAKLALVLVRVMGHKATSVARGMQDHLLQVFRSCIRATVDSNTSLGMRDICYRLGCSVISIFSASEGEALQGSRRQLVQQLQEMGDRIVRILAEDAFSDRGVTRVSALLFLDAALKLSVESKSSNNILRSLARVNFVPVLVDTSIGSVADTFRRADMEVTSSLAYFHTAAAFLLRLAQSPEGPQLILRSDFIAAVEDSGLFSTDPDIGLDIDNPAALQAFYRLLSAIVRILVAIVIGRGSGDRSVIQTARQFLIDNRISVSAIFKLVSKRGALQANGHDEAMGVANELSRLMLVTDFLEADESLSRSNANGYAFS